MKPDKVISIPFLFIQQKITYIFMLHQYFEWLKINADAVSTTCVQML